MDKRLVVKSNFLIEASYKLSAIEQKIILSLATRIKKEDQEFQKYSFNLGELSTFIGLNSNADYGYLQEVTRNLLSKVLVLQSENSLLQTHWFESVEYFEKTGNVTMRFSPDLKPCLLHLKENFTKFQLKYAIQLKSRFSIRIYELLKQYESIGSREFLLSDLRVIIGVGPDEYPLYGNFKAKVLNVAKRELRAKTDLSFDFEEIKIGRSVGKIRFNISQQVVSQPKKSANPVRKANQAIEEHDILELLPLLPQPYRDKFSVKKMLKETIETHGLDYVMRNIVYTNDKSNASNYRAYLAKALRDDYGLAYMEDRQSRKEAEKLQQKTFAEAERQKQHDIHKIDQERDNRSKARVFMESFTPATMQQLEEEARSRLSPDALERYNNKHYTGIFEFKRKLEEVVMEYTGIIKAVSKPEQTAEAA